MNEPFHFKASARLIDFMRQADEPGLINLAAGVPGLDSLPAAALSEAMGEAIAKEGARLFAYHHPDGDHGLRELLAARLEKRGVAVKGSELFTTTGCTQGLSVMLSVIVQPGDVVAIEAPAYYGMLEILSELGARVLPLPLGGDGGGVEMGIAEELLSRWKPRCLVICSSLSNPSGATVPEDGREQLVEICRGLGVRIIEDDIYAELVDGGAPKPMRAFDDGSTVSFVSSFSKSISPGLRVGYCVPGSLFDQATARKCQQDLHSAVPTEAALREFLAKDALDPHLEMLRVRNARRRAIGMKTITRCFPAGTRVAPPRGGYMLWAEFAAAHDLAQVRARARAQGVAFALGDVFYTNKPGTSYMRLNCAKATEEELVRGLEIIGSALAGAD
ncbi:MAG: GntR family transcriptional regulator [Chthoniobacteraceae bacterium]|nr:GntR family transcriptional regulator [Chthoniobacteraceae bacterium]